VVGHIFFINYAVINCEANSTIIMTGARVLAPVVLSITEASPPAEPAPAHCKFVAYQVLLLSPIPVKGHHH
jgi:hypothetical protein